MQESLTKKKLGNDLLAVFIITCIPIILFMILGQNKILGVAHGWPLLFQTIYTAFFQFSIAGLGLAVVMLYRKEKFSLYGLKRKNILISCIMGVVFSGVFVFLSYIEKGSIYYLPFRQVNLTADILKAGLPVSIIAMAFVVLAWGFFEGFNYIYISRKINQLIPIKIPFLRLGPIIMGISCIFIHGAVGQNMLAILGSFLIIYLTLMIFELTDNAWGCILVFILYWNAV